MLKLDLTSLNYSFIKKPLLIGGKAMEYYGLRKSGDDIDLVVTYNDLAALVKKYPQNTKDLSGDYGVTVFGFEIWKTICYYDYDYLSPGAVEEPDYLVISLEKLLFLKALGMKKPKYLQDLYLITDAINKDQGKLKDKITQENNAIADAAGR